MESYFVHSGPVALHVLESGVRSRETPSLLVIGGLWEPAERAIPLLSGLPGHVVALSLRGRGLSSTPETGYGLADHLSDIDAVVKHCHIAGYCVLGFSRGASYALGWTLQNQHSVCGLILVDQPPVHQRPGPGYVEFWSNLVYLGAPVLNFMRRAAIEGLERDAVEVDFSPQLSQLKVPVALFVGRDKEATIPSDLSDAVISVYKRAIPACEVVEFNHSGHMIPDEEQEKYIAQVTSFLKILEYRDRVAASKVGGSGCGMS